MTAFSDVPSIPPPLGASGPGAKTNSAPHGPRPVRPSVSEKAPPPGDDVRLRLDGVGVRFGGIVALDGVSLHALPGEVRGLIGPNGAGKTTLFDVIAGVRTPSAGQVVLDGNDVTAMAPNERARRGVRRTFQRLQTFGWLSVEDNVIAAMEWRGGGGGFVGDVVSLPGRRRRERQRRAEAQHILEQCGLIGVRHQLAGSLPIGTARMVELARAVVDRPSVLLLDEPASGLDRGEAQRLADQIALTRAETGCAVLLVEHNAKFVMDQSDRVVVLDQGGVLALGTPGEIQSNALVRDAYLGSIAQDPDVHRSRAENSDGKP